MQEAAVVLGVLRERGRKGLPCTQLYRQMFSEAYAKPPLLASILAGQRLEGGEFCITLSLFIYP